MTRFLLLMCLVAPATIGCAEFDLKKNIPWGAGEDGKQKPPMKVAAIWTDTVLNQAGAASLRGFGGRLMFYASAGGKPIQVKGSLVVYAFDEKSRDPTHVRPDRKFVFTAEQFAKHYSKSALGHSYSVWLPWDEAGGPRREISLLVRFTPDNGPAVVGDESRQMLPGFAEGDPTQYPEPGAVSTMPFAPTAEVQPVAYHEPLPGPGGVAPSTSSNAGRRMTTTTISLPGATGLRTPAGAVQPQPRDGASVAPSPKAPSPSAWQSAQVSSTWEPSALSSAASSSASPSPPAEGQPSAHFGPPRRRPLGEPLARLTRDRAPWQPSR